MKSRVVKDFMERYECMLKADMSYAEAVSILAEKGIDYAPVINDEKQYAGIFATTAKTAVQSKSKQTVKDLMYTDLPALSPFAFIEEVQFRQFPLPVLPVVESNVLLGVITEKSMNEQLSFLLTHERNKANQLNSEIMLLQKSFNELNEMLEHSYDGFAITNNEGITIRVNKAWDRLTGLKREDVIGIPLEHLVETGYFSDSVTMKVIQTKKPTTIIQKMKSGKQAMMTGSPVFDENGQLYQVIINIRDITELHQLKESLESKEKLAERYQHEISQIRLKQTNEDSIIAESRVMQDLLDLASRVARVESTVLLTGESGVGKGVIARFIHQNSLRGPDQPFIIVNCGAIPQELLESELFGYVGGAFTGANRNGKPGMFELADGGTLFLDEIAELPLKLQVKLLHVIQEKEVTRVGGTKPIKLNVRLISATNKDLLRLIDEEKFREDLYYRLNVVPLSIPPLRARVEDILPLSAHYLNLYNKKYSLNKIISNELMDILLTYKWPGNIRELANVIERMVVTASADILTPERFPNNSNHRAVGLKNHPMKENNQPLPSLQQANDQMEFELISRALEIGKTQAKAADLLGISLRTLIRKMKRLNFK
ncbi:PAS domain S-box protein [Siminovitchia acidinfaciens]|uniref:PAS domain S-box protein n=1 Tax=Siminovitchia acidinfaciens TaxID=2321395 RepID=A0A429Y7K1_9BACI|nr:sigma 54-interacting transcriptional regulator [Siminovitchia acidinfaciens]RST77358.1 PAS domain S-box protein [Siminovitchia acidinfaciens]